MLTIIRTLVREYSWPVLLGITASMITVYMISHPSSCRYEEVC